MIEPEREYAQIVSGNIQITKKCGKNKFKIVFNKISDFLLYQVFSKGIPNFNNERKVLNMKAEDWVMDYFKTDQPLPRFQPTCVMWLDFSNRFVFVINNAKVKNKKVVFIVSVKDISLINPLRNINLLTKIPIGSFMNVRFDINGKGLKHIPIKEPKNTDQFEILNKGFVFLPEKTNNGCNDGCPVDKFPDGIITGLSRSNLVSNKPSFNDTDILYSIYNKYKKTFIPTYIQNNLLQLTNPDNYSHLPMGPSNIFIIKHGEKVPNNYQNPTNDDTFSSLDCNGIYRSIQLPTFINNLGKNGYPITHIVTTNDQWDINIDGNASIRPQQTVFFSSWALSIPVLIFGYTNCSQPYDANTAINIFTNKTLRGKNILISYEHGTMQGLVNQLVQCYIYFKQGGIVKDLNNSTLYNVSTEEWWKQNTPVDPMYQYSGLKYPQQPPKYPIPYQNYSKYLPYWNEGTYDRVYWMSQTTHQNNLNFKILSQNINTCQNNECDLLIGLMQWAYTLDINNEYKNDLNCLPP